MNNNIHSDKPVVTDTQKTDKNIANTSAQKEIDVGALLRDTLKKLSQAGLDSVNIVKAMLSLKGIFPSEYNQAQLQARQAQIDKPIIQNITFTPISSATQNSWHSGQVVHAKVLNIQVNGQATLLIDKQTVEVQIENPSKLKLQEGQNIALAVEKIVVEKNTSSDKAIADKNDARVRFILSSTPEQSAKLIQLIESEVAKQQAMPALLASIDSIMLQQKVQNDSSATSTKAELLSAPVIKAIEQLFNQFSTSQQLSLTQGLKDAISNSGIFLENKLAFNKQNQINLNALSALLSTINPSNINQIVDAILSKNIAQLEALSLNLGHKTDSQIILPINMIKTFNQSLHSENTSPLNLHRDVQHNFISNHHFLKQSETNINALLSELKSITQAVEKQTNTTNLYPKEFTQSIRQVLDVIYQQFNKNNPLMSNNSNTSFAQSQAKQFSSQLQNITQAIGQAISNSSDTINYSSQINNDLKLNLQRLLSVLQNIQQSGQATALPSSTLQNTPLSQANLLLAQNSLIHESELNRLALPTRNKHAQVVISQQIQSLQLTNPSMFQQRLVEQLEGVMSRIVATQAAIREQPESNMNMALELPFKFQDKSQVLQLKFTSENKDKNKEKSKEKIWTANLAFELQSLGAIRIYIVLDGKDISMQFWTEKPATQKIFVENFSTLKSRLKLAGYQISEMTANIGVPDEAQEEIKTNKQGQIDERV